VLLVQDHAGEVPPGTAVASVPPAEVAEMPGWNEGRTMMAIDCGVGQVSSCIVEPPPGLMAGN
jgi:hypothetical protein